jgi:hypothetical protein
LEASFIERCTKQGAEIFPDSFGSLDPLHKQLAST